MNREFTPNSALFIAGHNGLVGQACVRIAQQFGHQNCLLKSRAQLDLEDASQVAAFFEAARPEYVVLAAAKVGGIAANSSAPAQFIHQNLAIQNHVIHQAYRHQVKRLLFLGSSCIYPRECPQPIREEYLLSGPLEPTNRPYALAKIAGIEMCWAYNRQYGTQYVCVMPTNLYGPNDNFDLDTSHVIGALIHKMHLAKVNGQQDVEVWGTGQVRREFLYVDDLALACWHLLTLSDAQYQSILKQPFGPVLNIGVGEDLTILELAQKIQKVVGFEGRLVFNPQKPDGTPQKKLDVDRMKTLGIQAQVDLDTGLQWAYQAFLTQWAPKRAATEVSC